MIRLAAWMLGGNLALLQLPALPGAAVVLACVALALLAAWRGWSGPAIALLAFAWTGWNATQVLAERLDPVLAGVDVEVTGRVADFPSHGRIRSSFLLRVDQAPAGVPRQLRLSWYGPPRVLEPGEALALTVRLRPPRGLANPGGSDQAGRSFRAGIGATGYVRAEHPLEDPGPPRLVLLELRARLAARVEAALGEGPGRAVLLAVGLGTRHALSFPEREVLARTGTSHLMAISGLHVGLVAGLGLVCFRWLWGWLPAPCRRVPPLLAGAALGLLAAAGYALLAGFAIPTRRALLMLSVVLAALCLRRPLRPGRGLALAALAVLAVDPLATLDPSFWLSFLAVAVIVLVLHGRLPADPAEPRPAAGLLPAWQRWRTGVQGFGRLQWLIVVGMAPATGLLFAQVPLVSPLANALLVPLFTLVVVPGTLLGLALLPWLPQAALAWLGLLAGAIDRGWPLLERLAAMHWSVLPLPGLPLWGWALMLLAVVLLLLPKGLPGRWLAVPLLAVVLSWRPAVPAAGGFHVWLLDVGHGLAVLVRTERHALLYDAGPAQADGFDAGRSVVLPLLRHQGIARLDTVIISHGDNDHAGGLASVRDAARIERLLVGGAAAEPLGGEPCLRGQAWHWDGVDFEMLHPESPRLRGNEGSCVLSVRGQGASLLLTGDIERWGESSLLALSRDLRHTLVQVPHHGSLTSSSPALVAALEPRVALVAAAYDNRWNLPRPEVVARWEAVGAAVLNTADAGAIEVRVTPQGEIDSLRAWRERRRRFWHPP